MKKAVFILFLLIVFTAKGDKTGNQQQNVIDDEDKTSSRISDMITGVEQAKKVVGVTQGTKEAVDMAKNLKNINLKEKAIDKLKGSLIQYKNSRQSFIQFISGVTDKVTDVLDRASKRVNMWRTTEPTLIAFGEEMKQMADNTIKVFSEFRPKDLVDIDRKWSRKMEDQLISDKRFTLGCIYFLNYSSSIKARQSFNSLFLDDGLKDQMMSSPIGIRASVYQMTKPVHSYRRVPSAALHRASESIEASGRIVSQAHESSDIDPSISIEQQDFNKIQQTLEDSSQTYEDARDLSSFIALKKQIVTTQCTQLQQILSMLQADIARMYLNDQEIVAMQSEQVANSLKILSGGAPLQTIDEAMKEAYQK